MSDEERMSAAEWMALRALHESIDASPIYDGPPHCGRPMARATIPGTDEAHVCITCGVVEVRAAPLTFIRANVTLREEPTR